MTSSGVELEFKENSTSPVSMMMEPPEYKEYDEEIVKKVREFAMLKITPKAIQVRLKTLYGKTVKIMEIKDIVIKG
jgi:hypothetical protein